MAGVSGFKVSPSGIDGWLVGSAPANLYVSPSGNDANDGLTAGTPLRTVGKAWSKIPNGFTNNVAINLAAGSYGEDVILAGKEPSGNYSIAIRGAQTVQVTGTATSGSATTLADTSKSWATNGYYEYFVKITAGTGAGQTRQIKSNTGNTLTVQWAWGIAPDATSQYTIYSLGSYALSLQCYGCDQLYLYDLWLNRTVTVSNHGGLANLGFYVSKGRVIANQLCISTGFTRVEDEAELEISNSYSANSVNVGFIVASSSTLWLWGVRIRNAAVYGLYVATGAQAMAMQGCSIVSNGATGVFVEGNSVFYNGVQSAAGLQNEFLSNTGWGIYCQWGAGAEYCSYGSYSGNTAGTYGATSTTYGWVAG